jgi:hypothetical protein
MTAEPSAIFPVIVRRVGYLLWKEPATMSISLLPATPAALALRQSPIPALRGLHVEVTATAVTISGKVTSYYLKQLAQETLMPMLEQRKLHNQVAVIRP